MIDRQNELPLKRQAQLLGISRGAVYHHPEPVSVAELALMRRIDELHLEHLFAGTRMLRDFVRLQGVEVGRRHVGTLMRRMGIQAVYHKPNASTKHPSPPVFPYALRGLAIERVNQVWALDITYIPMARGWVYLVAVLDWHSRRVLAHRASITMEVDFCVAALREAAAHWERRKSSTPTRAASSAAPSSSPRSSASVRARAWTARGAGATTCSSSGCGAA
jgi:putative transposase